MIKRYLSLLLALIVAATLLTACAPRGGDAGKAHTLVTEQSTERITDTTGFKLSYTQSDSLNPYESKTLNNQVMQTLVFESLFVPDDGFEAQPAMATGYSYEDDTTLNVTIPSGLEFSDGSKLTADSVVNAFREAQSSPHWREMLRGISSAEALSSTAVQFRLAYKNPHAHNLLTFAIASGKEDKKGYPIGSGRYRFGEGDGTVYLEVNPRREDFKPHFTKITLVNVTTEESIENAMNIGNISYAFRDMSRGGDVKMKCATRAVNLTNLVYIGINGYSGITADASVRRAISLAVDRDTLVKSAYRGYGKSALSPFHPASRLGRNSAVFSAKSDLSAARQALLQSGYSEKELKVDILVNRNAQRVAAAKLIRQQLEEAGFTVTVNIEKSKTYQSRVKNRNFDIYIGETRLPNDMNMRSFFAAGGATHYGINTENGKTAKTYRAYLAGKDEIGSFTLAFSQEMPFVPLLYRQGMICTSKSLQGEVRAWADNYFMNIEDWYYN